MNEFETTKTAPEFHDKKGEDVTKDHKDLTHLLIRCGHILGHKMEKRCSQRRILKILSKYPDMSQKELQKKLEIEAGSLSEIVNKLESRGLVKREKDTEDKRKMRISLTERGSETIIESQSQQEVNEERLFAVLNKEEREVLKEMLIRLTDQWSEEYHHRGGHHKCGARHNRSERRL